MALTDTFIRTVKSNDKTAAKYSDGDGMYLLVTSAGKYWRMDYRYLNKRKTLALGTYPAVSLAKANIANFRKSMTSNIFFLSYNVLKEPKSNRKRSRRTRI